MTNFEALDSLERSFAAVQEAGSEPELVKQHAQLREKMQAHFVALDARKETVRLKFQQLATAQRHAGLAQLAEEGLRAKAAALRSAHTSVGQAPEKLAEQRAAQLAAVDSAAAALVFELAAAETLREDLQKFRSKTASLKPLIAAAAQAAAQQGTVNVEPQDGNLADAAALSLRAREIQLWSDRVARLPHELQLGAPRASLEVVPLVQSRAAKRARVEGEGSEDETARESEFKVRLSVGEESAEFKCTWARGKELTVEADSPAAALFPIEGCVTLEQLLEQMMRDPASACETLQGVAGRLGRRASLRAKLAGLRDGSESIRWRGGDADGEFRLRQTTTPGVPEKLTAKLHASGEYLIFDCQSWPKVVQKLNSVHNGELQLQMLLAVATGIGR